MITKYKFAPGHGRYRERERFWCGEDGKLYASYTPDGEPFEVPGTQRDIDYLVATGSFVVADIDDTRVLVQRLLDRTSHVE